MMKPWIVLLGLFSCNAFASVDNDLNSFFNNLGFSGNVTGSEAYQGQSAGYYTGGSLFLRNGVRNTQLASVQLPSFRGGCGGIDLFTGGFSYIKGPQLIQALKNVANNATSYAFMLAIETVSPLIAEQMKNLQEIANKINDANINSCETGASLVGALWPKTDIAQKQVCAAVGTSNNIFSDWAEARQGCGAGGERSSTLAKGKNDPKFKDLILDNGNIAWQAINKNDFLAKDTELAELFMSLSGTIIIKKNGNDDNASNQIITRPSLATNSNLLKALMHGEPSKATIYSCDDTKADACLNVAQKTITIKPEHAFINRIKKMLSSIVDKIRTDEKLTDAEIGLLQTTRLPIYKMLNVNVAYARNSTVLEASDYADVIAADILYQYLSESLDVVLASSSTLQVSADLMADFRKGVETARLQVAEERRKTVSQIHVALEMVQRTQLIEQQLSGMLSVDLADTLKWANGLR